MASWHQAALCMAGWAVLTCGARDVGLAEFLVAQRGRRG